MWSLTTAFLLLFLQHPDPYAEGLKALETQNYALAVECFTKAVAADPKDHTAHFNLAFAYTTLAQDADAITEYKKALELKPGLYEAELNLGLVLLRQKRAAEARPHFEQAAEAKPKEFRPRLYLSDALLGLGNFEKAAESYKAALELNPTAAPAELGIAQALARGGKPGEAEPHFHRAAEIDPTLAGAALELAEIYEKAGQKEDAIRIYSQFPESVAAQEHLGNLLVEAGRPAEAIPHLELAVKQSPSSANRLALAQAYRKNHEPDKELPLLAAAVEAAPNDLDLKMGYGRELRDQRRYAEAAKQFATVAGAQPNRVEALNELAGMLVSLENYPQAIALLDRIRSLGAETEGHMYLRAIVLDRVRDLKGALESYQKFLAASQGKHPDEEFIARQRARILEKELKR